MPIPLGIFATAGASAADTGAYELISTATPSGVTQFTLSSIPQTYKHLQIRFSATLVGNANTNMAMYLNGTTGSQSWHHLRGVGTSVQSGNQSFADFVNFDRITNADESGSFMAGIIDISDYASTSKYITTKAFFGYAGTSYRRINLLSGNLRSSSGLTSVTFSETNGAGYEFASGTRFSIYGIKG